MKTNSFSERLREMFGRFGNRQKRPEIVNGKAKVVAVVNQKGGVGKTTTAVNLSACLAEVGQRVLLVDIDPQGNATSGVGLDRTREDKGVYNALIKKQPITELIEETSIENLYVVPATSRLVGAEIELVPIAKRETRLEKALDAVRNDFDYILIDCPPSLGLLTVNGLVAARELIVPIQCEYYALEGLGSLWESYRRIKNHLNPDLGVGGIVMTMYDGRAKLSRQVVEDVKGFFKNRIQGEKVRVFTTIIPRTVKFSEAPSFGQPITVFDGKSKAAKVYKALAKEVIGDE